MREVGQAGRSWFRSREGRAGGDEAWPLLAALFMLIGLGNAGGATAGEGLFVGVIGVAWLPAFFVASDLAITAGSFLLGRHGERGSPATVFRVLDLGAIAGGLGLLPLLGSPGPAPVFALYLLFMFVMIMTAIHSLTFLRAHLDLGQIKRMVPVLYGIQAGGSILGGLAVKALVPLAGNRGLVVLWIACLGGQLAVLRVFERRIKPLPTSRTSRGEAGGSTLARLRAEPLAPLFMLVAATSVFLFRVMDVHSNRIFARVYPGPEELSSFYGVFGAMGSLVAVILGTVVTPWFLARIGLGRTLMVLPLYSLAVGGWLMAAPGLGAGLLARGNVHVLRGSMLQPVLDVLQSGLPGRLATSLNLFVSGVVIPAATILAAVVLGVLGPGVTDRALGMVSVSAALLLTAVAPLISRAYSRTLVRVLEARRIGRFRDHPLPALELPPQAMKTLLAALRSEDGEKAATAAELLTRSAAGRRISLLRESLVACRHPDAARVLLLVEGVVPDRVVAGLLLSRLVAAHRETSGGSTVPGAGSGPAAPTPAPAPAPTPAPTPTPTPTPSGTDSVLFAFVEFLAGNASPTGAAAAPGFAAAGERNEDRAARHATERVGALEELTRHPDPAVRLMALAGCARACGPGDDRQSLLEPLRSPDPAVRTAAVRAVAIAGVEDAIPVLVDLLADPACSGRALGALRELDHFPTAGRLERYEQALATSSDAGARGDACELLARGPREAAIETFLRLLSHAQPSIVRQSMLYLAENWQAALDGMDRAFASPSTSLSGRQSILALWADWGRTERLQTETGRLIRGAYESLDRAATLDAGGAAGTVGPVHDYMVKVLHQRARESLVLAAEACLLERREPGRASILAGLASEDPALKSRALEALLESVPPRHAEALTRPLRRFEPGPLVAWARDHQLLGPSPDAPALDQLARGPDPYLAAGALLMLQGTRGGIPPVDEILARFDPLVKDCVSARETVEEGAA